MIYMYTVYNLIFRPNVYLCYQTESFHAAYMIIVSERPKILPIHRALYVLVYLVVQVIYT